MKFPTVKPLQEPIQRRVIEFKGYDTQNFIDDGAMRDMKNLTSDEYPCLYPRRQRGIYTEREYPNPEVILSRREKLAVIDSNKFYYNNAYVFDLDPEFYREDKPRQMVAINTRICIFPDKIWYNIETGEHGDMEYSITTSGISVHKNKNAGTDEVTLKTTGLDLSQFKEHDALFFSGTTTRGSTNDELNDVKGIIVKSIGTNKIVFEEGYLGYTTPEESDFTDNGTITISRDVPDLDYVIEYNNRLYGCKGSTIYVSKLGDPLNWNYFGNGTADCSYSAEVGSDGDFTGCAAYSGHILFFKENYVHKLYGYKPSNYQLTTYKCIGLEAGSDRSIVNINDTIFFKSREGIMVYSGELPGLMSGNFGNTKYVNATAGTDGIKYYVSMKSRTDGKYYLFVYDTARRNWVLEDNTRATSFAFFDGVLAYVDADRKQIIQTSPTSIIMEGDDPIEWYAVFGDYDEFIENKKVYSEINMRIKMEQNSDLLISIQVDNGEWERIHMIHTSLARTVEVPIIPRRCDKFKIRLDGHGYSKIESMTRLVREGTMR